MKLTERIARLEEALLEKQEANTPVLFITLNDADATEDARLQVTHGGQKFTQLTDESNEEFRRRVIAWAVKAHDGCPLQPICLVANPVPQEITKLG